MAGMKVGGQTVGVYQAGRANVTGRSKSSGRLKIKVCDYSLVFMVIFLVLFGMVMMYSATLYTDKFVSKQLKFAVIGVAAMFIVSMWNYHTFKKLAPYIFIIGFVSMLLVLTPLGRAYNNSTRWVYIKGVGFQPAEIFKIATIIFNAAVLNKIGKKLKTVKMTLGFILMALGEGLAVILLTDNLSSAVIIIAVALCMMFVAGPNKKICILMVTIGIALLVFVVLYYGRMDLTKEEFMKLDFRTKRILRWLQPEKYSFDGKNFQTLHSLYAIGSGSLGGKGLGNSTQKMILPEAMNDMIFAIVCEELGFVGATFLLVLYGILMQRLLFIARNAKELFGSLIAVGLMGHIGVQVMLNVAVATNLIPNTGVTLPFFSYGGTALVIIMGEMGIALSISRHISLE